VIRLREFSRQVDELSQEHADIWLKVLIAIFRRNSLYDPQRRAAPPSAR
jgi:hypothetical protein